MMDAVHCCTNLWLHRHDCNSKKHGDIQRASTCYAVRYCYKTFYISFQYSLCFLGKSSRILIWAVYGFNLLRFQVGIACILQLSLR